MNCDWVEGRVPRVDLQQLRARCARGPERTAAEAEPTFFRYPANCQGMGEIWRRLARRFPAACFRFGTQLEAVDLDSKTVS